MYHNQNEKSPQTIKDLYPLCLVVVVVLKPSRSSRLNFFLIKKQYFLSLVNISQLVVSSVLKSSSFVARKRPWFLQTFHIFETPYFEGNFELS